MSNIYVKIPGVPGEATTPGYGEQIECTGMTLGIDLPVIPTGSARSEGASIHGAIELQHVLDSATPKLRAKATGGDNLGTVVISRTRVIGGATKLVDRLILLRAALASVFIDTPLKSDGSGPADGVIEVFSLDYDEIQWEHSLYTGNTKSDTLIGSWSTTTQSVNVDTPEEIAKAQQEADAAAASEGVS